MLSIVLNKKVKGILEDVITPLGTFLMTNLQAVSRNWWEEMVLNCLTEGQLRNVQVRKITKISELDLAALIRVFDSNWNLISQRHEVLPEFRNILKEMRSVRNRWSHTGASSYPKADIYRDLDTLNRFAKEIGADTSLLNSIKELMAELLTEVSGPVESKAVSLHPKIKIEAIEGGNYDADILSVAAGKTKSLVDRYHIHSCPDHYAYKRTKYITFRAGGTGEMDAIYEINKILIIPTDARDNIGNLENNGLNIDEVQRLINYIKQNPFPENDRYYILSVAIDLPDRPKPPEVNAKTIYYSLSQLRKNIDPKKKLSDGASIGDTKLLVMLKGFLNNLGLDDALFSDECLIEIYDVANSSYGLNSDEPYPVKIAFEKIANHLNRKKTLDKNSYYFYVLKKHGVVG